MVDRLTNYHDYFIIQIKTKSAKHNNTSDNWSDTETAANMQRAGGDCEL